MKKKQIPGEVHLDSESKAHVNPQLKEDSTALTPETSLTNNNTPFTGASSTNAPNGKGNKGKGISTRSALFRSLVQNSYDNIMLLAEDGTILHTTPSISRILGYAPEEVIGLDALTLVHPEDAALVETAFNRLITQGRHQGTTYRCQTKDGEWRWLESNGTNLLQDRAVGAIVLNSRDVTKRRQAEEDRETNLALFNSLVDNMPAGTLVVDDQCCIFAINEQFCRIFGIITPPTSLLNTPVADITALIKNAATDPEKFIKRVWELIDKQEAVAAEEVHLANGRIFERHYFPIYARTWNVAELGLAEDESYEYDEDEPQEEHHPQYKFVGHCWQYYDVTARKQVEAALAKSEGRFRTSVEAMHEGFIILSAVRNETGHITDFRYEYINRTASNINRLSPKQHVGRTLLEILPHVHKSPLFNEYAQVVETGQPLIKEASIFETINAHGERERRVFDYQVVKMDDGIAVTGREITQRNQIEEALSNSEQRFSKIFHSSPIGIALTTYDEGRILDVNDSLLAITGHKREELVGLTSEELGVWNAAAPRPEMVESLRSNNATYKGEVSFRTKAGEVRTLQIAIVRTELHGQEVLISFINDITDHQHL